MPTLICGSLAYDTLLTFQDSFHKHILPDQLERLSVCFMVPQLRKEFGGCAGNIAYTLKQLGDDPLILATAGEDFEPYHHHLTRHGIRTEGIRTVAGHYTAQCFITSDRDNNQITAFHPGAMQFATLNHAGESQGIDLAIVAPTGYEANLQQSRELAAAGIPFIFDPGQELPLFSRDELLDLIEMADYIAVNAYEAELLRERTGLAPEQIAKQVQAMIVTAGAHGSTIYTADQQYPIEAVTVSNAVDPTGCGDAYRAGLLYGIKHQLGWTTTGRLASLLGAIKVASQGGQNHYLDWPMLRARFEQAFGQAWPCTEDA